MSSHIAYWPYLSISYQHVWQVLELLCKWGYPEVVANILRIFHDQGFSQFSANDIAPSTFFLIKRFHLWNRPCIIIPFVNAVLLDSPRSVCQYKGSFLSFAISPLSTGWHPWGKGGKCGLMMEHYLLTKGMLHNLLPVASVSQHRLKNRYLVSNSFGKTPNLAKNPWQEHMAKCLSLGCLAGRGHLILYRNND